MDLATNRAGYRIRDDYDQNVLAYMCGYRQSANSVVGDTAAVAADIPGTKAWNSAEASELLLGNIMRKDFFGNITTASAGDHSIPLAPRLSGETALPTATASPAMLFNRAKRLLDQRNVDTSDRWAVVDPTFIEVMGDEGSRFLNADFGESGDLRNGRVADTKISGFRLYVSNNLPAVGTGPGTSGTSNQNTDYGVIVFGHNSAVATAEQLNGSEKLRSQDEFADIVRGKHLFGRKILRPEALVTAKYNIA